MCHHAGLLASGVVLCCVSTSSCLGSGKAAACVSASLKIKPLPLHAIVVAVYCIGASL